MKTDWVKKVSELFSEVDYRIEHGAESNGHLEYVREKLREILSAWACDILNDWEEELEGRE